MSLPLAILAFALLLTGCSGRPNPFRWTGTRTTDHGLRAGADTAPLQAPTNITLSWNYAATNVEFNVYSAPTPSLSAMTLKARTPAKQITFPANETMEFFGVRAVRGTNESGWATQ